jgi:hypothetical protein
MYVFATNAFLWLYSISKSKIFTSMTAHVLSHITFYRVRGHIVKGRQSITRLGDLFMLHHFQQWYQCNLNFQIKHPTDATISRKTYCLVA